MDCRTGLLHWIVAMDCRNGLSHWFIAMVSMVCCQGRCMERPYSRLNVTRLDSLE